MSKKQIEITDIFGMALMLIPCISFISKNENRIGKNSESNTVKILFTKKDKVEEISLEDYMIGSVLAQMPADFEEEALKSQAVLTHTYILRRQITEQSNPDKKLNGADISDDSSLYQSYFTEKKEKKFYGDDYEKTYKKVSDAVNSVKNKILTYENEPIIVAFHAISSGSTESAENMWGEKIPYLISVNSSWDTKNDGFEKTTDFTADELSARLSSVFPELKSSELKENSIKIEKSSDCGSVLSLKIDNQTLSGIEFSNALSLPSPCFTLKFKDNSYTIKTKGYGHLVGMSQYGANYMAKDGKNYDEILAHYFPETSLTDN